MWPSPSSQGLSWPPAASHYPLPTTCSGHGPICPTPTRFSGVTEADLADTSITLRDVQAVLLSMFSADTILIGHSLESDLLALKVAPVWVVPRVPVGLRQLPSPVGCEGALPWA